METAVSSNPNYNPGRHLPPRQRGGIKKQIFKDFLKYVSAIALLLGQMEANQGDSGGRRVSSASAPLPEIPTGYTSDLRRWFVKLDLAMAVFWYMLGCRENFTFHSNFSLPSVWQIWGKSIDDRRSEALWLGTVLHACVYKSRNLLVETLYFHFVHTSLIKWNESINVLLISGLLWYEMRPWICKWIRRSSMPPPPSLFQIVFAL